MLPISSMILGSLSMLLFVASASAQIASEVLDAQLKKVASKAQFAENLWSEEKLDVTFLDSDPSSKRTRIISNCVELDKNDLSHFTSNFRVLNGQHEEFDLFQHCAELKALKTLKDSQKSFLGEINLGADWHKLPLFLSFGNGERSYEAEAEQAAKQGTTLWSWGLDSYQAVHREGKADRLSVTLRTDQLLRVRVLARGDYNGDGIEDLVLGIYASIGRHDSLQGYWVLTKKEKDTLFRSVDFVVYSASQFEGLTSKLASRGGSFTNLSEDLSCAGDVLQDARAEFKKLYMQKDFEGAIALLLPLYQRCETKLVPTQKIMPTADLLLAMSQLPKGKERCETFLKASPPPEITYASIAGTRALAFNRRKCFGEKAEGPALAPGPSKESSTPTPEGPSQ